MIDRRLPREGPVGWLYHAMADEVERSRWPWWKRAIWKLKQIWASLSLTNSAIADELDRLAGPETPGSPTERVIGADELRARARELREGTRNA